MNRYPERDDRFASGESEPGRPDARDSSIHSDSHMPLLAEIGANRALIRAAGGEYSSVGTNERHHSEIRVRRYDCFEPGVYRRRIVGQKVVHQTGASGYHTQLLLGLDNE